LTHRHIPSFPTRRSSDLIARILDLLVLADAVETHRLCELDVVLQCLVIGRGHAALRPIALIEDEPHQVRPAVQEKAIALHGDRSDRKSTRLNSSHLVISY